MLDKDPRHTGARHILVDLYRPGHRSSEISADDHVVIDICSTTMMASSTVTGHQQRRLCAKKIEATEFEAQEGKD